MQFFVQWSWLIPLYGLTGALAALPWATRLIRKTGPRPAMYINVFTTALAVLHGLFLLQAIWNTGTQEVSFEWLQVAGLNLSASLDLSAESARADICDGLVGKRLGAGSIFCAHGLF